MNPEANGQICAEKCLTWGVTIVINELEVEYVSTDFIQQGWKKIKWTRTEHSDELTLSCFNGGSGDWTHDAAVTRRTLYDHGYWGSDENKSKIVGTYRLHTILLEIGQFDRCIGR